jgi:hypothetical protein
MFCVSRRISRIYLDENLDRRVALHPADICYPCRLSICCQQARLRGAAKVPGKEILRVRVFDEVQSGFSRKSVFQERRQAS